MKNLAVFDFDHTVIDDNSDTAVMKLVDQSKFSPELKQINKVDGWTAYMQGVFNVLHENQVPESSIVKLIKHLPEVPGMSKLILELHTIDYDIIIISDSNTVFIDHWLEFNNLSSKILKVFSNPAKFDEQGRLNIKMYHVQETCKLSTRNLCKGMIMEEFIKEQNEKGIKYNRIVYVGDGQNDVCPILRLDSNAIACCRAKYKCADFVNKIKETGKFGDNDAEKYTINAEILIWSSGDDILNYLK